MPSRVFDGINNVIDILTAAGANVVDSWEVVGDTKDFVFIGYDGDPDGDLSSATINQDWAGIGTRKRNEFFDIVGAVVSSYSADAPRTVRDRIKTQFTLVENAILADPSIGLSPPCVAGVNPVQLFTDSGQYRLVFTIRVQTRV